jgi:ABC-type transport system substrate-binding protein
MRDVRRCPNFGAHFPVMNTRKAPYSDVRVRYALNMATDKHAIAAFFGDGRTPLKGVVPPLMARAREEFADRTMARPMTFLLQP